MERSVSPWLYITVLLLANVYLCGAEFSSELCDLYTAPGIIHSVINESPQKMVNVMEKQAWSGGFLWYQLEKEWEKQGCVVVKCVLFLSGLSSSILSEWWQWKALYVSVSRRFEVYCRSFRGSAYEGFHFYCLEAGGGIIAPHCTGGSRGWRLAAAEGPIDYWPGVKFYPACFSCLCQILYYPQTRDVKPPTRGRREEKAAIWCFIVLFYEQKRGKKSPPPSLNFVSRAFDSQE